jgi:putative MATE family efflux protein
MKKSLTEGSIVKTLIFFAIPYLLAAFMQSFYGMVDLYVVGKFNTAISTNAVSIGSQVMHMITVIIVGLAMGTTVVTGRSIGAHDEKSATQTVRTSIIFFALLALAFTVALEIFTGQIVDLMLTPTKSRIETIKYLRICFAGIPFIVGVNLISAIFRGAGDSKSPMCFIGIACIVNIILDFIFVGSLSMGASGAAAATIIGQAVSVLISLLAIKKRGPGFNYSRTDAKLDKKTLSEVLKVGIPIAAQDGFVQIAFMVITVIANSRGFIASTSVGIVEKLISFMFLVPSAFLSAISAITAQNVGAGKTYRAEKSLKIGIAVTITYGLICAIYNQFLPETLIRLFTKDSEILAAGCDYMKSYSFDCVFAAIHFCFSGYFCGSGRSGLSFIHNIASILLVRIPGAYLTAKLWPKTLYPMGWAAPLGSLLSAILCIVFYRVFYRNASNNA